MSESFAELFEESLVKTKMRPGSIVPGTVVQIDSDFVIVNAGLKSEGVIPLSQFFNESGELEVVVGDVVDVAMDMMDDGFGETRLSREKAKRAEAWTRLEVAHEANETVVGTIADKVKGGFT
ncbi:MAG: S1 RNA-binding domain-containing protein, partial [Gammaproteobacteria bacterium]|nr:S1 RNA-binding domain-containing protein [Gammaproteobacteria bacterium]